MTAPTPAEPVATSDLAGATDLGDPRCHSSSPGEFAARWNSRTEEQRAAHVRWIQEDADVAQRCRRVHSGPSPSEEVVEPGLNAESNGRRLAWFTDDELSRELTRRAALASPAPAPHDKGTGMGEGVQ